MFDFTKYLKSLTLFVRHFATSSDIINLVWYLNFSRSKAVWEFTREHPDCLSSGESAQIRFDFFFAFPSNTLTKKQTPGTFVFI